MKSLGDCLLKIAVALLTDAQLACDVQGSRLEKDISRLETGLKTRGLAFFTLDLPSIDEILLSSLESEILSASGPFSRCKSKEDPRPRFLHGLWSKVFDPSGRLKEDADPSAIYFLRQIFCLGKKLAIECAPYRTQMAVAEYHSIESAIVPPSLNWEDDVLEHRRPPSFIENFGGMDDLPLLNGGSDAIPASIQDSLRELDCVSRVLVAELGLFDPLGPNTSKSGRFRHGPGAVADAKGSSFKYDFPHWPWKLENTFPFDWCGSHTVLPERYPSSHEPPCRLIAVLKTAKAPRLIAAEPTAHQWCQQKVSSWLAQRFEDTLVGDFISLKDQMASQTLVRRASALGDLATLDLSSASDRLSCRHVESLLAANRSLLEVCHASRTRWVRDTVASNPSFRKLQKFAAMGSALTFPIQSLFFLACCLAACKANSRQKIKALSGVVRVYGDDLIVPVESHARLVALLTHLGLKVNVRKSFSAGNFRESCGLDCFKGVDVTPIKPKALVADSPERSQAVLDTANNFFLKGCWHASMVLDSTLQSAGYRLPVVGVRSGAPGYVSFCGYQDFHLAKRWDSGLQVEKIGMHLLVVDAPRVSQDKSAALLQYFTEAPKPDTKWSSGVTRKHRATFARRWVDPTPYKRVGTGC